MKNIVDRIGKPALLEQTRAFRQYANENLECWDYDPVATIDTNDPEDVQPWEKFMEEQAT